jgi:hypothetical protein
VWWIGFMWSFCLTLHRQVRQRCVFLCRKLLDEARLDHNFCLRAMTGDEIWLYYSTQEPKSIPLSGKANLLHVWKSTANLVENLEHVSDIFWVWGHYVSGFVPPGQAVNQPYYSDVLQCVREQFTKNVSKSGRTRSGWFAVALGWCTLPCQGSRFWLLKIWLWYPTLCTCLISPFVIYSCFQVCNCTYEGVVSWVLLKFRSCCWLS